MSRPTPSPVPSADLPNDAPTCRNRRGGVKSLALVALIVLNAALVLSLVGRFIAPHTADAAAAQAVPSEYMMIPARPSGQTSDILYVLDTQNNAMVVVGYNQNGDTMEFLPPVGLREMFAPRGR